MSEFERAFNIGRGYFDRAKDAILGGASADSVAEAELNAALSSETLTTQIEINQAEMQLREELTMMNEDEARLVLGIDRSANYSGIKAQYDKFVSRITEFEKAYPGKKAIAARERRRIERAYAILSKDADATEKRFGSLEID